MGVSKYNRTNLLHMVMFICIASEKSISFWMYGVSNKKNYHQIFGFDKNVGNVIKCIIIIINHKK